MDTAQALQSMTGFARAEGSGNGFRWTWELRSVNGKGLDIRFRAPPGFDQLDPILRERAAAYLSRGALQATLTLQGESPALRLRINQAMLDELLALADELRSRLDAPPVTVEGLLAIRGVVETYEVEGAVPEDLAEGIVATLDRALGALAAARGEEGAQLGAVLHLRLDRIEALTRQAEANAAAAPEALRARLAEQVALLLDSATGLDPLRLHQEAALLATRADIREELDRLMAHVAAARSLLAGGGAIGRRLDFLAQEFNRETNTLCAKSTDKALTAIGLELKAVVDQLREQVQNLE